MLDGTPRTRAELIKLTGLARSTVGARVDALLAAGLLTPSGEAASTGGRPPAQLAFNPDAAVVIGADLGATHALVALTDLRGRVVAEKALEHRHLRRARGRCSTGWPGPAGRCSRRGAAARRGARRRRRRRCPAPSSTRPGAPSCRRSCPAGTTTTCPRTSRRRLGGAGARRQRRQPHGARRARHRLPRRRADDLRQGRHRHRRRHHQRRSPPSRRPGRGRRPRPRRGPARRRHALHAAATSAASRPSRAARPSCGRCASRASTSRTAATSCSAPSRATSPRPPRSARPAARSGTSSRPASPCSTPRSSPVGGLARAVRREPARRHPRGRLRPLAAAGHRRAADRRLAHRRARRRHRRRDDGHPARAVGRAGRAPAGRTPLRAERPRRADLRHGRGAHGRCLPRHRPGGMVGRRRREGAPCTERTGPGPRSWLPVGRHRRPAARPDAGRRRRAGQRARRWGRLVVRGAARPAVGRLVVRCGARAGEPGSASSQRCLASSPLVVGARACRSSSVAASIAPARHRHDGRCRDGVRPRGASARGLRRPAHGTSPRLEGKPSRVRSPASRDRDAPPERVIARRTATQASSRAGATLVTDDPAAPASRGRGRRS